MYLPTHHSYQRSTGQGWHSQLSYLQQFSHHQDDPKAGIGSTNNFTMSDHPMTLCCQCGMMWSSWYSSCPDCSHARYIHCVVESEATSAPRPGPPDYQSTKLSTTSLQSSICENREWRGKEKSPGTPLSS